MASRTRTRQRSGSAGVMTAFVAAEAAAYCHAHPESPSALHRPAISYERGIFLIPLGDSLKDGVFGAGRTVEAALREFDLAYLGMLRRGALPTVPRRTPSLQRNDAWLRPAG